jgi:hypothetical protein
MTTDDSHVVIEDSDELYRRLASAHVNADGSVNSLAYKQNGRPADRLSVDLARLTTPHDALSRAGRPGFQLGVVEASSPRSLGFSVNHDPLPDNNSHSVIEGPNNKERCRRLALATTIRPVE